MPRTYVDNAMNRGLERVGMAHGTAVHSSSSGSSSYSSGGYCGFSSSSGGYGGFSSSSGGYGGFSSGTSARTYVDNSMNRGLERVGLTVGTAVHSKGSSSRSSPAPPPSYSASSSRTYVDNAMNRGIGRVGQALGTAVQSPSRPSPSPAPSYSGSSSRLYVDNALNRKLVRVGLPVGTAVQSKGGSGSSMSAPSSSQKSGKVYTDNAFNRRHKRVGLPLGSKPVSSGGSTYAKNAVNDYLGRVGKPMGSQAVPKGKLAALRQWLQKDHQDDASSYDSGIEETTVMSHYDFDNPDEEQCFDDDVDHVLENLNRAVEEDKWMESQGKYVRPAADVSLEQGLKRRRQGKVILFEDLELGKPIGHGGFGKVYFANYMDQIVAVKVLTNANLTKKRLKMFEEEIMTHSRLEHPNVVRFLGPCLERPNLAIVMEYMDGSLWDSIHVNEIQFSVADKLKIIRDVTNGLDYLHSIPLVHGDLKTQNVLLILPDDNDDSACRQQVIAKLSDFGLSLLRSDSETSTSSLQPKKQPPGATMRYAAPEVLRGNMLSGRELLLADIFSMGLLIYELAVEEIPFEDLNMAQLQKQVGDQGKTPLPPAGLALDAPLKNMLDQCWRYEPGHRVPARELKRMAFSLSAVLVEEEE